MANWGRVVVSRVAQTFTRKVLPFVATPVAIGAGVTAGALAMFFHLTDYVRGKEQEGAWKFDHTALDYANKNRTPARTRFYLLVSDLANPDTMTKIGIASFVVALILPRWRARALLMAVALAGGGAMVGTMKYRYARARPTRIEHLAEEITFSFPSGHSFIAVVFYGIMGTFLMRAGTSALSRAAAVAASMAMILLIGASRVYLGVHYPSDVLAGYAAATPWLTACLIAFQQYERRGKETGLLPPGEVV